MVDICCIGHITSDKVVTPSSVVYMPGGTAWYFSHAMAKLDVGYLLVTSLGQSELKYVDELIDKGINVKVQPGAHTVYFENIYGDNPDERTQNVLKKADRFEASELADVSAAIFHLGPLLADDISIDLIKMLAAKGRVSVDVQGYLRKVTNKKVYPTNWSDSDDALPYVSILKADEAELLSLTGQNNVKDGVYFLADKGVNEIVITNGSKGSMVYDDGIFYNTPAYFAPKTVDTTGCGDTYMAGYLYSRVKHGDVEQSAKFAAAMAGLKTNTPGPFMGTAADVIAFLSEWDKIGI